METCTRIIIAVSRSLQIRTPKGPSKPIEMPSCLSSLSDIEGKHVVWSVVVVGLAIFGNHVHRVNLENRREHLVVVGGIFG